MTLDAGFDDALMTARARLALMTTPQSETPYWDLKNLVAWQVAMDFATAVYTETRRFPSDEKFGLRMQLRRAAVSVASNIAEGHGRSTRGEYVRFLRIARGSLKEAETQILLSEGLGYMQPNKSQELLQLSARINRLLTGLQRRLGE